MENKKLGIIIAVIVVLVAVGALYYGSQMKPGEKDTNTSPEQAAGDAPADSATRSEVGGNVAVPDQGATDVAANVAVPVVVGPAGPTTSASFRKFAIKGESGAFTPDTVIVRVGDTVHLDITAVDRDYDFTQPDYGFKAVVAKGQTKPVEFQATAEGKFLFYCSACGGPDKGPKGYIVVAPKG